MRSVGSEDGRLWINVEGSLHAIPQLARYKNLVGRQLSNYQWTPAGEETGSHVLPARTCRGVGTDVGRFDPLARELEVEEPEVLADSLGVEALPGRELMPSDREE